ncbi:MAG TPA: hypothetical protein VHZ53_01225 [Steroidobacteraceae bacterium]|jgi:hypothetical protein|nr:hypothetical protein [Steroidobacteraceae bacterium]
MQYIKQSDLALLPAAPLDTGSSADYRARVLAQRAKIVQQREHELSEQASRSNTPEARIRIWERLHQVALPRAPTHKILDVIAAGTGLSIEEVRTEQTQRLAAIRSPI